MQSLKSRLVAFVLRHTRKKAFRSPEGLQALIERTRKIQDHRPPPKVASRLDIETREIAGWPVYEARPKGSTPARRILYLHGGAFCFELTPFHWRLIAEMAERLGAHVSVPIYPLAPEHDFHDAYAFAGAVWRDVVTHDDEVIVMGDSAGGTMALVLSMMAATEGWARASRLVLISPAVDATLANPRTHEIALIDPWLDIPGGRYAFEQFAADVEFSDWRISPIFGDLAVLPPALVLTGTHDLLYPDTVSFAEKARAAGVDVTMMTAERMFHVWPLIDMREARTARDRIVEWLEAPRPGHAAEARVAAKA